MGKHNMEEHNEIVINARIQLRDANGMLYRGYQDDMADLRERAEEGLIGAVKDCQGAVVLIYNRYENVWEQHAAPLE